ncbi:hypothetical protein HPP92_009654 [Vanilla planifolia]|uniref:Uncharacterized protein n=1 Tax=Vanilla planifolia TaxID=51239 RepID=A0A835REP0_VANPL|nr:hypothetical protein HPP92_009654 [Vanilla planifolia]
MDSRGQNYLYTAPPQLQHVTSSHLYSYGNANPNSYPNQVVVREVSSTAALATGGIVQANEHCIAQNVYNGVGAVAFSEYQSCQQAGLYAYRPVIAAETSFYPAAKKGVKIKTKSSDLESKKQKVIEEGAAADAIKVCAICNVVCNSDKVFLSHLTGEKHALKALGIARTILPKHKASDQQLFFEKNSSVHGVNNTVFEASNVPKVTQFFVCEVCKIECNSQEALNSHNMGKKHKRKLQNHHEASTPKPSTACTSSNTTVLDRSEKEEAIKKKPAVKEDLETKREKVLNGGAAKDAVKICIQCNVVCNSSTVYSFHIAGKKHRAMMKNQA